MLNKDKGQKKKKKVYDPLQDKDFVARLLAVQAVYQSSQNSQPAKILVQEFLDHRIKIELVDADDRHVKPNGTLFKDVVYALNDRFSNINVLLENSMKSKISEEGLESMDAPASEIEPLLRAIILCAMAEILVHHSIDKALIINDYLNVTHSFYNQNQVRFVNGILDQVAKSVRS